MYENIESLAQKVEHILEQTQCEFKKRREIKDKIFILRQVIDKAIKTDWKIHLCFIDIIKENFDQVTREEVWKTLKTRGINMDLMECIKSTYSRTLSYVRVRHGKSNMFTCRNGLKQGCALSPLLFNIMLDEMIKKM